MISCVLFAGGKSSRMGKNKAFLPFGDSPTLVDYQYNRLKKIFPRVYLSAKDKSQFNTMEDFVIEDSFHQDVSAPTVGLISMFKHLQDDTALFVLSVDTPFVSETIIKKLLEASDKHFDAIIARTSSGIHPLCGIYTRSLEETLIDMVEKGEHKLGKLLKSANVAYVDIEEEDALMNLNTPEEYVKAVERLSHML